MTALGHMSLGVLAVGKLGMAEFQTEMREL